MKGITYQYSSAFKQKVVTELETGKIGSINEARKIYGIAGGYTIQKWIKKMGKNEILNKVVRVEMKGEADRIKELEKEKQRLESALAQEHLKVIALESLLEVAEEEYGIEIKKNYGQGESKGV